MNPLQLLAFLTLTFSLTACQRTSTAGSDRDAYGCIASAGYAWSPITGACVRIFEAGLPFEPTAFNPEQNLRAYVVVPPSKNGKFKSAELFWPGEANPWTLDVIHTQEGDTRPVVLQDKTHRVKIYRNTESAYLLEREGRVLFVFGPKAGNPLDSITWNN